MQMCYIKNTTWTCNADFTDSLSKHAAKILYYILYILSNHTLTASTWLKDNCFQLLWDIVT
jgi:hypothetical protein